MDDGSTASLVEDAGGSYHFVEADITENGVPERIVSACVEQLGSVDILINSAGICPLSEVQDFGREKWDATVAVNLIAAFENGVIWSGESTFNDTFGFAASPATAESNGGPFDFASMAAHLEANPDAILCMEAEFPVRPDGLILFEEETGYEVPESQQLILGDAGIVYTETQNENCDFGEVFTTDGRIEGLGLSLVEDPGVMVLYNVAYTYDAEVHGQFADVLDQISSAILAPFGRGQDGLTQRGR